MKRGRLFAIAGSLTAIALACCLMFGCSTTQCTNAKMTMDSAQIAYDVAIASGNAKQIQDYGWTLSAARAIVVIWCSTQSDVPAVTK